jgi:NADH dehydrogenase
MKTHRILILGGGFGGVYAARRLERIFARRMDVEITLISGENFLLFTPMLAEVVSSSIEANHIVSPIRAFFRRVRFQNADVEFIDLDKRVVISSHCAKCGPRKLEFDHLVLSLGSTTDFHGLPGVAENARPMKTLGDAMTLRNHIIDVLEHADIETDSTLRKAMLTFVVAGGGFAGTETVAELHDFVQTARHSYRTIRQDEIRVVLAHSSDRIMPEISGRLADYALRKLKASGIEVVLNARVSSASDAWVELNKQIRIATRTLIWTGGVTPNPLLSTLPCERNRRGRVITNEYLAVPGQPGLWALGDCAEILNGHDGKVCPPTAQHAIRQGKVIAENIAAALGAGTKIKFAYKPRGILASLGRHCAVAEICGFNFSGFFAWWLWRTIYLLKLPGLERKMRVALDWTLDLFFVRDTVLLKLFMRPAISVAGESQPGTNTEGEGTRTSLATAAQ